MSYVGGPSVPLLSLSSVSSTNPLTHLSLLPTFHTGYVRSVLPSFTTLCSSLRSRVVKVSLLTHTLSGRSSLLLTTLSKTLFHVDPPEAGSPLSLWNQTFLERTQTPTRISEVTQDSPVGFPLFTSLLDQSPSKTGF